MPEAAGPSLVSDVTIILLGTGTSAGVPVIACDCEVCRSTDPRDKRTRCSAALQFKDPAGQDRMILIDTSPDLREQSLRHNFQRCDAIIYTHGHVDHTFGLDDVRRFNAVMKAPIDLYADTPTMKHLQRVYQHIFRRDENINDSFVATLLPHLLDPDQPIDLFGIRFTPLKFLHGRQPVLGFRMDALDRHSRIAESQPGLLSAAYCTDVSAVPPATWKQLTGLNSLILDMLRYRSHPTHFTVDDAISTAERIGAKSTYFTHMTHDILHADLDARLPESMHLGYDGLKLS